MPEQPNKEGRARFVWLDTLLAADISCTAARVGTYLFARCHGNSMSCWPSLRMIGQGIHRGWRTVTRKLGELERAGLVTIERRSGLNSKYRLQPLSTVTGVSGLTGVSKLTGDPCQNQHETPVISCAVASTLSSEQKNREERDLSTSPAAAPQTTRKSQSATTGIQKLLFGVLDEAFSELTSATKSGRSRIGKLARELVVLKADEAELKRRLRIYEQERPPQFRSPESFVRDWGRWSKRSRSRGVYRGAEPPPGKYDDDE